MPKRTSWYLRIAIETDEKKAIKALAEAELRSVSNMVVMLLKEALTKRRNLSKDSKP